MTMERPLGRLALPILEARWGTRLQSCSNGARTSYNTRVPVTGLGGRRGTETARRSACASPPAVDPDNANCFLAWRDDFASVFSRNRMDDLLVAGCGLGWLRADPCEPEAAQ